MVKSSCEKYLYIGNQRGSIYQLDTRKNCQISSKISMITTTIKDMKIIQEYLAVISLDGHLRIFNTQNKDGHFQKYLNIHPEILALYPDCFNNK
jgi:folate-dependent phosphoribosylglycinamide formyltransferase PurN